MEHYQSPEKYAAHLVEMEIDSFVGTQMEKLSAFALTDNQKEFIQTLMEQAFIEGRKSGLNRAKEILNTAIIGA